MAERLVRVRLDDDTVIAAEVSVRGGEVEVAAGDAILEGFEQVRAAIEKVSAQIAGAVRAAKPDKASVELGFDLSVEAGKLTALIAKGSGSASIKVTLDWEFEAGGG